MASRSAAPRAAPPPDIKQVPQDSSVRQAIYRLAAELMAGRDRAVSLHWDELQQQGEAILRRLALPGEFLGFAMVAASNAFWWEQFAAVPFTRRLFLLPRCLSDPSACTASFDSLGLHCAGCGSCEVAPLETQAQALGYQVGVAEGTSPALLRLVEGKIEAVFGVACLDSLEKSFARMVGLGIPHVAVPLLRDGCANTEADWGEVRTLLCARSDATPVRTPSYLPLLREAGRIFEPPALAYLLAPYVSPQEPTPDDLLNATDAIAVDWLQHGGKRLRPFITLAAYAAARHGAAALDPQAQVGPLIPDPVRRLALAIEVMHKASLVHDDLEDGDDFRYGRPTLQRIYGVPIAVNVGDFLIGLGYRLVAGEAGTLGPSCVADILDRLAAAHLSLCRGQGAELLDCTRRDALRPVDVLSIYAQKTAPALDAALSVGLRAADASIAPALADHYLTFLGQAYQVLNDLDDWRHDHGYKADLGRDALAGRPTILRAFAEEAGGEAALAAIRDAGASPDEQTARIRALYEEVGAFEKAERLLEKLRVRALNLAARAESPALRELLAFLVRMVIRCSYSRVRTT